MPRVVEAVITQLVYSNAIVTLDDDGSILSVDEIIEDTMRVDAQVEEVIGNVEEEGTVEDPREV